MAESLWRTTRRSYMVVVVPLDRAHIVVQTLEGLLPEAVIAGGSFGLDLRHPIQVPRNERQSVFRRPRRTRLTIVFGNSVTVPVYPNQRRLERVQEESGCGRMGLLEV